MALSLTLLLAGKVGWGQTTVFSDDFSTDQSTSWTISGTIGSSAWTVNRSGDDWGARRNTTPAQLELTNDVSATANVAGWVFANVSTSSFSSPYNTTLNSNTGLVTWIFNMRQFRSDPSGFSSTTYGVAFILGATSSDIATSGNGYAITLGGIGSTDPVKLVKFTDGIQTLGTSQTGVIVSSSPGDLGADYLSIKVTYNPQNDQWELYLRNDSASFSDPNSGTLTSQGTATDNSYTNVSLDYIGAYWQGSTSANQTAFFDNVFVTITPLPTITLSSSSLSNFSYLLGSGPSAEQSFTVEGSNLTDDITVTPPTNYEISLTSGSGFATDPIVLSQSGGSVTSTTIYVRLKAGLSVGNYIEDISVTSTGAVSKNVSCSGTVYLPEPTNHATSFVGTVDGNSQITLNWTDATGGTEPTGYLIMVNTTGTFTDPVDGTPVADDTDMSDNVGAVNVAQGTQTYVWTGLTPNTTYYFKIFPYTNSGSLIDYKIDGVVPTDNKTTTNILPEPTNHATAFAVSGVVKSTEVTLTWTDAVAGAQAPENYVILINTTGTFTHPTDGTPIADDIDFADDAGAVNVAYGVQTYTFNTLIAGKTYYARIYPYTNSGASINYKTDGTIPEVSFATPKITVTVPNGGERYFAGDNVTITWTSANMDTETIKYEAYIRQGLTTTWFWEEQAGALPNTGTFSFQIPADAQYGIQYKVRLTGNTSGATDESDAAFTIIATPSIYQVQSQNDGSPNYASLWANDTVRIAGIVTAVKTGTTSFNIWIQDSAKAWNGVYVYGINNSMGTIVQGDSVEIVGTVDEYNNLTEVKSVTYLNKINSGNTLPTPVVVTPAEAASEAYEGVLVQLTKVECTVADAGYGEFTVSDGTNTINVDDILFKYTPTQGSYYNIYGVVDYSYGAFKLLPRSADDVYLYSNNDTLSDLKVDGTTITGFHPDTLTYNVELPYGTTTVPTVTYTLSDSKASAVKTDAASLPGSTTVQVTAEDGSTQTYTINFTVAAPNTEANILTFTVAGVDATIDAVNHTITANVPYSTDITNLVATFTLSAGATAKVGATVQESGVTANDFTNPVVYTVTAEDGTTTQNWTVTITKAAEPSHEANITAYSIDGVNGTIDAVAHTVAVTLPYGTNVTALVATFTLSTNAIAKVGGVDQVSGTTANDFTSPVVYTVTAEDGTTTQDWTVTVTVTPASTAKDITSFTISNQVSSTIDAGNATVTVVMPYGTSVTSLTPTIEVSEYATISPASGVAQDFTNPVTYTVTAQDNSTKPWTVTVTVQAASSDATVSSSVYTVNSVDGTITNVPYNTTLSTFKSNITPADGATFEVYQSDGITPATDLQTGYKLICTAQDGTTKKTYTITLNTPPAAPILYEGFDYAAGSALQGQGGWAPLNTGDEITVTSGSLSYPGFAPSAGNKVSFAGIGLDYYNEFNSSGITSGKVYYSFIIKVTDLTKATNTSGGYFMGFAYDNTTYGATVWTKRVDDNSYNLGVASRTSTSDVKYSTDNYTLNSEILVVASYEFVDGTANDVANIWINPASQDFGTGTEPTPTLTVTNTGGTDLTSIKRILIRQDSDTETPAMDIDEIRVGDTWAQVTPTGALSSDATVTSTVYTVDSNAGTITNVPLSETLANFKANITPAAGATFEVYQSDGTTVATDLQTGYKLICTAEDGTTKKTYTITLNTTLSTEANILSYSINGVDGTIDAGAHTIALTLPYGTNVTNLVATFTLSAGANAKVGATLQVSGTTANDFTNPVVYAVTAEDGTTTLNWTVTVTVAAASSEKDILTFTIPSQVSSVVDAVNATVAVVMPLGTDVTNLTPTITVSQYATISPASGVAQNFTNPVTYTVTAQDNSTKPWTVTVTVQDITLISIYSIQYTTDASGDSPLKGQQVYTTGVVTAVKTGTTSFNIWIQDNAKAWNGVYVYGINNSMGTIVQGDSVEVIGTVDEYNNLTEIKTVTYLNKISSGNTLPTPVVVTPADAATEVYEGVLVRLNNVECTNADAGYGEFTVSDGTNTINIDDFLYKFTPTQGARYNITGVVDYGYGAFKVQPRSADDIESAEVTYTVTFTVKRADGTTPVADATITVTGQGNVTTDANGQATMQLPDGNYSYVVTKTGFDTNNGNFTVNGADLPVNITLIQTGIPANPIAKLSVYPNPFNDRIYFTGAEVTRVTITSVIGQVVLDRQVENAESIDVGSLNRGIYLVRFFNSKGETVLRKLVKE